METINITKARQDLYKIVESTITNHKPIQILGKQGGAVLISTEDWEAIQETIYLSSIKGFKESLDEVNQEPLKNWVSEEELEW